jgi:hypothetical protein
VAEEAPRKDQVTRLRPAAHPSLTQVLDVGEDVRLVDVLEPDSLTPASDELLGEPGEVGAVGRQRIR